MGIFFVLDQFAEMMVEVVAAADAAAGAIDAEHHGLDVLVFHRRVDRPLDETVLAFQDDAFDRQDDDLVFALLSCETNFSCTRGVPSATRLPLRESKMRFRKNDPHTNITKNVRNNLPQNPLRGGGGGGG